MRELRYKHCPCGQEIDDAQTHCSDECADMPGLKATLAAKDAELAALRGELEGLTERLRLSYQDSKFQTVQDGAVIDSLKRMVEDVKAALAERTAELSEAKAALEKMTTDFNICHQYNHNARAEVHELIGKLSAKEREAKELREWGRRTYDALNAFRHIVGAHYHESMKAEWNEATLALALPEPGANKKTGEWIERGIWWRCYCGPYAPTEIGRETGNVHCAAVERCAGCDTDRPEPGEGGTR